MARGYERPPWWAVVVIVVGLVGIGIMIPIAVGRTEVPRSAASATASPSEETPSEATISDAINLLAEPDRPWTLSVLGDSTGNEPTEWVYLLAQQISASYSRPVTIHNWSVDAGAYDSETAVGRGEHAPVVIWNGSAPGRGAGYSLENLPALQPERPDLFIVNHGHNQPDAEQAVAAIHNLVKEARRRWVDPPPFAVTLQNPRLSQGGESHAEVVAAIRRAYRPRVVIDVWSAFEAQPALEPLLQPDQMHPNDDGERIWEQVAAAALGIA